MDVDVLSLRHLSMSVNIDYHRCVTTALDVIPSACCAPLVREPISAADAEDLARTMKALADPARLRLLSIVAASEGAEACVCDLIEPIGLAQPTVSHHLRVLTDAGFLSRSKRGTWAYYALVPGALERVADVLRA